MVEVNVGDRTELLIESNGTPDGTTVTTSDGSKLAVIQVNVKINCGIAMFSIDLEPQAVALKLKAKGATFCVSDDGVRAILKEMALGEGDPESPNASMPSVSDIAYRIAGEYAAWSTKRLDTSDFGQRMDGMLCELKQHDQARYRAALTEAGKS